MPQTRIDLTSTLVDFLDHHQQYGFRDRYAMVQKALSQLKHDIDQRDLEASANTYAELYAQDDELQDLTESAITGWPE